MRSRDSSNSWSALEDDGYLPRDGVPAAPEDSAALSRDKESPSFWDRYACRPWMRLTASDDGVGNLKCLVLLVWVWQTS